MHDSNLREAIYLLDSIQEGAKPYVEINEGEKKIIVSNLWVSASFDEEEAPSAYSVASDIASLVNENYPDYSVYTEVFNVQGQKEIFEF